jgi:predicted RecB family nuclease
MRESSDNKIKLAPTDLSNFLGCRHHSQLDLQAARGLLVRPARFGPMLDELRARGIAHEQAYLAHLEATGLTVARPKNDQPSGLSVEETLAAMRGGADIVFQASLSNELWSGRADFLQRVDIPSNLGLWSYEAVDTKLARDTSAGTILQLCVYSYLLTNIQGLQPEFMRVVIPGNGFTPISYRVNDYCAYMRLLERRFATFVRAPSETYPELVSHCEFCAWWEQCEKRRRTDDQLCYIAGIKSSQIKSLRLLGVQRLAAFAALTNVPEPPAGSREALVRMRDQARMQVRGRETNAPCHELIKPFDSEHGLSRLPEPTPDDIFLDFEGNHYAEQGVREYLTGFLSQKANGDVGYTALWARTLSEERRAFEHFIDRAVEVRTKNPKAHIYHFAAYEPSALKRLMGRYATREVQLDELLRGGAFVDLYGVVKTALIASVERYSIKDLEPFFGYARKQSLAEVSIARRVVERAIESGHSDEGIARPFQIVEDYNREDCESAKRLRDWLEQLRREAIAAGHEISRPEPRDGVASEDISELDRELQRLRDALLENVPEDPESRTDEQQACFVLAHMMEFHRREDKAGWWEYFRLLELEESEYENERRALTGLAIQGTLEASKAPLQRYTFPPQELDAREGDSVYGKDGVQLGAVDAVNLSERTINIKKKKVTADLHPRSVIFHKQISSQQLRESLMRLGEFVLDKGFNRQAPYASSIELLLRGPSPLVGSNGQLQQPGESSVDAACRLALNLQGHVLAIQGPPGTGKTYVGAKIICALKRQGLRIGVTAVSHKVAEHLIEAAAKEAEAQGLDLRAIHREEGQYSGRWGIKYEKNYDAIRQGLTDGSIDVLAATAWCWVRPDFEGIVDVLIVDEAGQMSLSNVLAASPGGKGLVLLGDPQQLEQPLKSTHPDGSDVSALFHLLAGHDTMPPEKGLFLEATFRLHPSITQFTSETYYEGRLKSRPELKNQEVVSVDSGARLSGSGLRFVPVQHAGNTARSLEEVKVIGEIVTDLLANGKWRNAKGQVLALTANDILVVAPYNAQVAALVEALPLLQGLIGTVDRFQGQEAAVVIYSMTSSTPDDAPRGMEFLYDRHRFNVATSRARALCVLVGNPALFEPECRTPRQMQRANGLCRYLELCAGHPL